MSDGKEVGHLCFLMTEMLVRDVLREPKYSDPKRLEQFGFKGNSQFDEDGIIQEIFRRIGTTDKRFIEFGAGGAECENNTVYLTKKGWSGLWLDGNPKKCEFLKKNWAGAIRTGRIKVGGDIVHRDNVNDVFKKYGFTGEMDLLNIDIDGNDYWVWEKISVVNPRVVVLEYNAKYAPPMEWIMKYNPNHEFKKTDYMGASLESMVKLSEKKGYKLVGCTLSGANAFFVRADLAGDHFCAPYTAENHYQPARYYLAKSVGKLSYNYAGMNPSYGAYVGEDGKTYE
nr:FkbM family methyltransferase [Oceanusvirus sp.]